MSQIIWNDNTKKVEDHGLTVEEVEHVLSAPLSESTSNSSGEPVAFGYTPNGTYIIVVYEQVDEFIVNPITAYEVNEPGN